MARRLIDLDECLRNVSTGADACKTQDPVPGLLLSDSCIKDSHLERVENVETGMVAGIGKFPSVSGLEGKTGEGENFTFAS